MTFYEIGSRAIPVVNLTFADPATSGEDLAYVEYPTMGVEGTVLSMNPTAVLEYKDPATYAYLLDFDTPIITSGVSGTLSIRQAWFSGEDLGVTPITEVSEFVSVQSAYSSLSAATSTTSTATSTVNSRTVDLPTTATRQSTMDNLNYLVADINTTVGATTIEGDGFAQQESAGQANVVVNYTANDAVLLQEAAESIADQEDVLSESRTQLTNVNQFISAMKATAFEQDTQDEIAYINTFVLNPTSGVEAPTATAQTEAELLQRVYGIAAGVLDPETELQNLKL